MLDSLLSVAVPDKLRIFYHELPRFGFGSGGEASKVVDLLLLLGGGREEGGKTRKLGVQTARGKTKVSKGRRKGSTGEDKHFKLPAQSTLARPRLRQ
jgi:hypothetical protein